MLQSWYEPVEGILDSSKIITQGYASIYSRYSDPRLAVQIIGLIEKEKINQAKTRIQSR